MLCTIYAGGALSQYGAALEIYARMQRLARLPLVCAFFLFVAALDNYRHDASACALSLLLHSCSSFGLLE
jgi:hypothetical protein